ncbi:kinase-like protein [Gyrodon lividus]|nr:kinase-like protein [Gyrodon lividus]
MKCFTSRQSTPDSKVGELLQNAFFSCSTSLSFPILSNLGIRDSKDVRHPHTDFELFMKERPVLDNALRPINSTMIEQLPERYAVAVYTFRDVKLELDSRTFSEEEMIACIYWWVGKFGKAKKQMSGMKQDPLIYGKELFSVARFRSSSTTSPQDISLLTIKKFVDTRARFSFVQNDDPLPPDTIPIPFTRSLDPNQVMAALGWEHLTIVDWILYLTGPGLDPSQDICKNAAFLEKVLATLRNLWPSITPIDRETIIALMQSGSDVNSFPDDLTRYVVREGEDPFASGGFGDVYRGTFRMGGRVIDVAVKAIRTYSADDGDYARDKKRFRREIRSWMNLNHINVLPLLGTTMNFGRFPAMVCPWLENGSLTSYLERRDDDLTTAERLSLLGDVAVGLQYLHSQFIVHGDLSGSNVLIEANGRACISDFGLSTLLTELGGSTFATSRQAQGTLRWTALELLDLQLSEDEEDLPNIIPTPQSDVFSFGRIMLQEKIPYHYYVREAQVVLAISTGLTPKRPSRELVTERQWTFIERCWTSINAGQPRPCDEEIVEFARHELVEIEKGAL